jgi:hypothetical protein
MRVWKLAKQIGQNGQKYAKLVDVKECVLVGLRRVTKALLLDEQGFCDS